MTHRNPPRRARHLRLFQSLIRHRSAGPRVLRSTDLTCNHPRRDLGLPELSGRLLADAYRMRP